MITQRERQQPHCSRCGDVVVRDANSELFNCGCCGSHGIMEPLWYSEDEFDIHDGGECHKMSDPCPICGKSAEDMA